MSKVARRTRGDKLGAGIFVALALVVASPAVAGEHAWTPQELADELIKQFGSGAQIEGGTLYLLDEAGEAQQPFVVDPSGGVVILGGFTTFSTGVSKQYGECATPIIYSEWAGPMFVKWCSNPASNYEAKSAYYFYGGGGSYSWQGSQLWDCENQADYDSMPPPVRIAVCQ